MASKAKLYYYPATGRGHAIRLALAANNIMWEDVYPTSGFPPSKEDRDNWRSIGGNTTTNIPMLQLADGKVYTQSSAVLRQIARMNNGGLMPKKEAGDDDESLYLVDKLIDDAEDIRGESYKCFVNWGAPKELAEKFEKKVLPLHLGNLERQLSGDYFVGKSLTIADIAVYDAVLNFGVNRCPGDLLKTFPKLNSWKTLVEKNPGIAAYLKSDEYAGLMKFDETSLGY